MFEKIECSHYLRGSLWAHLFWSRGICSDYIQWSSHLGLLSHYYCNGPPMDRNMFNTPFELLARHLRVCYLLNTELAGGRVTGNRPLFPVREIKCIRGFKVMHKYIFLTSSFLYRYKYLTNRNIYTRISSGSHIIIILNNTIIK